MLYVTLIFVIYTNTLQVISSDKSVLKQKYTSDTSGNYTRSKYVRTANHEHIASYTLKLELDTRIKSTTGQVHKRKQEMHSSNIQRSHIAEAPA